MEVQVITHHMQRYAVWFGGSMLASTVSFFCFSRSCISYFLFAVSSLSSIKCATQKPITMNTVRASVVIIPYSVSCPELDSRTYTLGKVSFLSFSFFCAFSCLCMYFVLLGVLVMDNYWTVEDCNNFHLHSVSLFGKSFSVSF